MLSSLDGHLCQIVACRARSCKTTKHHTFPKDADSQRGTQLPRRKSDQITKNWHSSGLIQPLDWLMLIKSESWCCPIPRQCLSVPAYVLSDGGAHFRPKPSSRATVVVNKRYRNAAQRFSQIQKWNFGRLLVQLFLCLAKTSTIFVLVKKRFFGYCCFGNLQSCYHNPKRHKKIPEELQMFPCV